jgi:HK97 family phage major capsid protein
MKYLEILRAKLAQLQESRTAAIAEMEAVTAAAELEQRSALTADEDAAFAEARSKVEGVDTEIAATEARIGELVAIEERTAAAAKAPQFIRKDKPVDVLEDRSATAGQLADALTRSIEERVDNAENLAHVRSVIKRHLVEDSDVERRDSARSWARNLIARSQPLYVRAFAKYLAGGEMLLTSEERAAFAVGTNTQGGFLLPTHLDPTIILTNSGASNVLRPVSRVVTLLEGKTWNGISSAGVTASWDGELAEVSDDTPSVANPQVSVHQAQAFVQASLAATEDIDGLAGDIMMMFADARDRLESAAHMTGSGTGQPWGIFTALDANTNVELTSTTAAVIGEVDIHSVYRNVPKRFRANAKWLMAPVYNLAVKRLGTAVASTYSGDLTVEPADRILGKDVLESDDAPTTQTTTALDNEIVLGDFSNYVIVDKPGGMSVEYIPHLFNTANNLPDGRRGWFAYWRTGADSVNDLAFRLLQDKTSA